MRIILKIIAAPFMLALTLIVPFRFNSIQSNGSYRNYGALKPQAHKSLLPYPS